MAGSVQVSQVVAAFLSHIESADELEVLLTLIDPADRWWDPAGISRHLGLAIGTARAALDHLASRNLLDIRLSGDVRYRFKPGTAALEETARTVVDTYRRQPGAVLRLIGRSGGRSLRDFGEAFKVRRDGRS